MIRDVSARALLLASSGVRAALLVAPLVAGPALADPCGTAGIACSIVNVGSTGTAAESAGSDPVFNDKNGFDGGHGGPADGITLTLADQIVYSNNGDTSPLQVQSQGGVGAQGSDATQSGTNKHGGAGGYGGTGGALNVTTTGPLIGGNSATIASAITLFSFGGAGGAAAAGNSQGAPGFATGIGGNASTITAILDGAWTSDFGAGVYIQSLGGAGGRGRDSSAVGLSSISPDGATGGNGDVVNVTLLGRFQGNGTGGTPFQIGGNYVGSAGGIGGGGGPNGDTVGDSGGTGGNGGNAGNVAVIFATSSTAINLNDSSAGLWVQSIGGGGGGGGSASAAGSAGTGGSAGNVSLVLDGTVSSQGYLSPGVLVQSIGGKGNDGGNGAGWFDPEGGAGATGGPAGTVDVTGIFATITTGFSTGESRGSPGLLVQSIGGGGGTGGHSDGWFAVGGDGANAVAGAAVTVNLTRTAITTFGLSSDGIAVQSIGGGGGKGGDASGSGVGINMTIGGTGGGGGDGAAVLMSSGIGDVITTSGDHATGLLLQSIGGGGGDAGGAYGSVKSGFFSAQLSVGGAGGAGGAGGTVDMFALTSTTTLATNAGRIITSGADSFGILGQSIGGGGGRGGASVAAAKSYGNSEYPNLSFAVALGGSGGSGGSASTVNLRNDGMIATSGQGGAGIIAQSVGGGGGTGGDASATSSASGGSINLTASVALGGAGGVAGDGSGATVGNTGLIVTTGESADGILVQSIGGGGGAGGTGDSKAGSSGGDDSVNIALTLTMGGSGGHGGTGGDASVSNSGAIITLGDGAIAIGAQSIGGGGGRAGGAAASTTGTYSVKATIGGTGGSGGSTFGTGTVSVTNTGSIVTFGADSTAIFAQSIGGTGGIGGKAGTSLGGGKSTGDGGNGSDASVGAGVATIASNYAANGNAAINDYTSLNGAINVANSLLGNAPAVSAGLGDDEDALGDVADSGGETDDDNKSTSIALTLAIGGSGGVAGSAGAIVINNSGDIGTTGKLSDAIIAQAIGGGGGKAGAATTASTDDASGQLALGGTGGAGGNGGQPTITNSGAVYTMGALSAGIVAQSIAGGGGIGGVSASSASASKDSASLLNDDDSDDGQFNGMQLSIGGDGGADGTSGQAVVTNSGKIITKGHDSIGIIAQSVAGGGGIVKTLAIDLDNNGGAATAKTSKDYDINLHFSGSHGATGESGLVRVTTQAGGSITTTGDNSYGILAQSISGGGGLVLGGKPKGAGATDFFGTGTMSGSVINDGGNNSGVFVETGDDITTSGAGAIGIFAQSIGGGGGIAGDTGWTEQFCAFTDKTCTSGASTSHKGNGGVVAVTVDAASTISTAGDNTPAIFVQSIGGGGGRVTNKTAAYIGTAGGSGTGGVIDITINGSVIATGYSSLGVFAQSNGDSTSNSPIIVTVATTGTITVGTNSTETGLNGTSAAIYIDHGGKDAAHANVVTNDGHVMTYGTKSNSVAVYSNAGYTAVTNNGTMWGDVLLTNGGGSGCFSNTGTFVSGDAVSVGACGVSNTGTIDIGGRRTAVTTITGNYSGSGALVFDADFTGGTSDRLVVVGDAKVSGTVTVVPKNMRNTPLTLVTATGTLTLDPTLATTPSSHLYDYAVKTDGKTLTVTPQALFAARASTLGANEKSVAANLQSVFDSGSVMDEGFRRMMSIGDRASYSAALKSLSGQTLGSLAAFRFNSSHSFIANMYSGCTSFDRSGARSDEADCGWARLVGSTTNQQATGDALGYTASAAGFQLGSQRQVADNWYVSGSIAYEASQFEGDGERSKITGDSLLGGAYLRYHKGPLQISVAVDAGYGWFISKRFLAVGPITDLAEAKPREWHAGIHGLAAYEVPLGAAAYAKPFVDLHAVYVHQQAYAESGSSPFNLAVEGQGETALAAAAGLEIGSRMALGGGAFLRPFASAAYVVLNNNDWTTRARFVGQPASDSFAAETPAPDRLGRFAVGVDILAARNVDLSFQYTPLVGKDYVTHAGVARLAYRF